MPEGDDSFPGIEADSQTDAPDISSIAFDPKLKRHLIRLVGGAFCLFFILLAFLFIAMHGKKNQEAGKTFVFAHEWVAYGALCMGIAGVLILLYVSVRLSFRQKRLMSWLGLLVSFFSGLFVLCGYILIAVSCWFPIDSMKAPDGVRYTLLFRTGPSLLLATDETEGIFFNTCKPVDEAKKVALYLLINPDSPPQIERGRLFLGPNDIICAKTAYMFLAYDSMNRKFITPRSKEFTPYILVDDHSPIHPMDEERLIKNNSFRSEYKNALIAALNHPNPNVRESARRVLEAMKAQMPASQP